MAGLRASLSGQVRQTVLPKWKPLLPLFEAVMNAHQAIQDRRPAQPKITILVHEEANLLSDGPQRIAGFTVIDNGVGFDDDNMDSFNTAFSEYKYSRGGKGLGRFLWLKAFRRVGIDSVFLDGDRPIARKFDFDEGYDPDKVVAADADRRVPGTVVELAGFREPFRSQVVLDLDQIARRMCEHFILLLMQPEPPTIEVRSGAAAVSVNRVFEEQFRRTASQRTFRIRDEEFTVYGFRLTEPRVTRHRLLYCANDRAVEAEKLDTYVPNLASGRISDGDESFAYLAVVTGEYLNAHVNQARTALDIGEGEASDADAEPDLPTLLPDEIKRSDVRDACVSFIQEDLAPVLSDMNSAKLARIRRYVDDEAPHYRILLRRASEFIDRMPASGSRTDLEAALHRELHQREVELKKEGKRIILEGAKLDDYEGYRDRLSTFMTNYNELGVAALAQYVAHRRIILDLFSKALSLEDQDDRYPLEKVLHRIIFPMNASSDDVLLSQQNLWILDERLNYHEFVSSDRALRAIQELDCESLTRPDLLIFDRDFAMTEGKQPLTSLTVIEFKRPMRDDYTDDDNPLKQVVKTVREIRAGSKLDANGRPISVASPEIPTNCYIVCDITPKLKEQLQDWDATPTPDGQGYYGYHRNHRLYFEVMSYSKVLTDAERRNRAMFERLNLA